MERPVGYERTGVALRLWTRQSQRVRRRRTPVEDGGRSSLMHHGLGRTKHCSCQGKPETLELGAIP